MRNKLSSKASGFCRITLCLLVLSLYLPAGAENGWNDWNGSALPQKDWDVKTLLEWNIAHIFYSNCRVDYSSQNALLTARGQGGIFGFEIAWPYSFEKEYIYKFIIPTKDLPDYILMNTGEEVWNKNTGSHTEKNLEFTFVPQTENTGYPRIYFVISTDSNGEKQFRLPSTTWWGFLKTGFKCLRKSRGDSARPAYVKRSLPEKLKYVAGHTSKTLSYLPQYGCMPVEYKRKNLMVQNQSSDLVFWEFLPIKDHLNADGINGIFISGGLKYPNLARRFDIDLLLPLLEAEKINHLCYMGPFFNKFILNSAKLPDYTAYLKKMADVFLPRSSANCLYILVPEVDGQNFGKWAKGFSVRNSIFLKDAGPEVKKMPLADVYRLAASRQRRIYDTIKKQINWPGRVKFVFMGHDALFELNSFYDAGADIVLNKNIGRQSLNWVTANARGTASSCKKEYGFEADCWYGWNLYNFTPEEFEDNLKVYFMSGGKYFSTEAHTAYSVEGPPCFSQNTLNKAPTALGRTWLEFVRWARQHPRRGTQQCRIAVMRSFGKQHKGGYRGGMDAEHRKILELLFPGCSASRTTRLSTGTPYGPVDIIPHSAGADILKKYDILIFIGTIGFDMNETVYGNLQKFVKNGGKLILPLGQMRKAAGRFLKQDMTGLFGVKLPETKTGSSYKKVPRPLINSGTPVKTQKGVSGAVKKRFGRGCSWLFLGDCLFSPYENLAEKVIREQLEKVKWLDFSPADDWLEYMVQKKGDCYILPFFNHGNVGFPSGNGKKTGPWRGKISLDLSRFTFLPGKLAVYESVYSPEEKIPFKLIPVKAARENNKLVFDLKIDKFQEIVVGPENKIRNCYLK
ncbi:MAG: hypothetical protein WCS27_01200 [Victivallaceae bacterium]